MINYHALTRRPRGKGIPYQTTDGQRRYIVSYPVRDRRGALRLPDTQPSHVRHRVDQQLLTRWVAT